MGCQYTSNQVIVKSSEIQIPLLTVQIVVCLRKNKAKVSEGVS